MSEVSDVALKRTQDSLGKLIKKPVLTEKLLRKPPFKFLHDIIHAVRHYRSILTEIENINWKLNLIGYRYNWIFQWIVY